MKEMAEQEKSESSAELSAPRGYCVQFKAVKCVLVNQKKKEDRVLLDDLDVYFPEGTMTAIMGSSGAGKTTMLNMLLGRATQDCYSTSGTILFGGSKLSSYITRRIGYVTQEPIMLENLTPRELLQFVAELTFTEITREEIDEKVNNVLKTLSLEKCSDTKVGTPGLTKGLSGGERCRANVALSLIREPRLLVLDEPTSGLDAKLAFNLLQDLRKISQKTGCTIISTIHQPSWYCFAQFDNLILLDQGQIVYDGRVDHISEHLALCGYPVPEHQNPAEYVFDALLLGVDTFRAKYNESKEEREKTWPDDRVSPLSQSSPFPNNRASFFQQLRILTRRNVKNVLRDKFLTKIRLVQTIMFNLLTGLVILRLGHTQKDVKNRTGGIILIAISNLMFATVGVVNTFPKERAVFLREIQDGLYSLAPFYLSKVAFDLLLQTFYPLLGSAIAYFLINFNISYSYNFFIFTLICILVSHCGSALGIIISALVGDVSLAIAAAPGIAMPQILLSGFFVSVASMSPPFEYISYIMFGRYAVQGLVGNEFNCKESPECLDDISKAHEYHEDHCTNKSANPCTYCCEEEEFISLGGLGPGGAPGPIKKVCTVVTCWEAMEQLGFKSAFPDLESVGLEAENDLKQPSGNSLLTVSLYNILLMSAIMVCLRFFGMVTLRIAIKKATGK